MPVIHFPSHLTRHVHVPSQLNITGNTVSEVLENLRSDYPLVVDYILDDQYSVRKHVNVFVESKIIQDRDLLTDTVSETTNIYVMQALSGG